MEVYSKKASAEQRLSWTKIWFRKFSEFHRRAGENQRPFTQEEVVAFLRDRRDAGVPAWKRMKMIEGLSC